VFVPTVTINLPYLQSVARILSYDVDKLKELHANTFNLEQEAFLRGVISDLVKVLDSVRGIVREPVRYQ